MAQLRIVAVGALIFCAACSATTVILVRRPSRRAFLTMLESAEYDELKNVRGDALAETMMLLMSEVGGT